MRLFFICACFMFLFITLSFDAADAAQPTLSWGIPIVDSRAKDYQYTLTNTATQEDGTPLAISSFALDVVRADSIIGGWNDTAGWSFGQIWRTGFVTLIWQNPTNPLLPGESVIFHIYTLVRTPTMYSWDQHTFNWGYNGLLGNSFVPVPGVPEPSSILTLLSGVVGLCGLMLRRMRG